MSCATPLVVNPRDLLGGVKGIAISPVDPLNQKPFIDELAGKIAVITCDSDIPGSKRKCYIGTDNVAAGRQAGKMIKEVLPNGGKIMLFVGKQDTQNAKERIQGIDRGNRGDENRNHRRAAETVETGRMSRSFREKMHPLCGPQNRL